MRKLSLAQILKLSVPQRIKLAQAVWDSVVQFPKSLRITESEREELDRRLQSYYNDPQTSIPWSKVKAKLLSEA